jgi:hypothetical protein
MLTVVDAWKVPYVPVMVMTDVPALAPAEPTRLNAAAEADVRGLAVKLAVQPVGMPLKLYVMATGPPVTPVGVTVTATAAVAWAKVPVGVPATSVYDTPALD